MRGDKDGDVNMDITVKGRGRIGKSTPPAGPKGDLTSKVSRGAKGGILSGTARSAILRQAASGDVSMKEIKTGSSRGGLVELQVTGWEKSKASSDADGGVSSLLKWMEKKASHRLGSRTRDVKIKKVCYRQRLADPSPFSTPAGLPISGPLSLAPNLRTTTAIQAYG
jgi:nuclear RNA export factor